jgi:predicted TIM-barrel enzyme
MVFDFLGDKTKVVIAMAHIGALPGAPLYDSDGGVAKLIEGVLKDIEALQAGGVDAIMFGNENDRRPGDQAASQGSVRRQLSLGSPRQRRDRRRDWRELRA